MTFSEISEVISDVRQGKPVVIVDDRDRENEGDLMVAAEMCSVETMNFMIQEGRGLVCLSLTDSILRKLALPLQVTESGAVFGTNFTVSIDHRSVADTGVSASSRTYTIKRAVADDAQVEEFSRPGFVFPLRAMPGGVIERRGQTEGSVDLARLAGLKPAGVICEIMNDNGEMVRGNALEEFCRKHGLKITSVDKILQYRVKNEVLLRRVSEITIPDCRGMTFTRDRQSSLREMSGPLKVMVYLDDVETKEQFVFLRGEPKNGCLIRIHSECLTGDVFASARCDCGGQFAMAMGKIFAEDSGMLIYLNQEGRGIGLGNKLRAYELQDKGLDTVEANLELGFGADLRSYRAAAQILADLKISSVRLMTNNPDKVRSLEGFGVRVIERVPLTTPVGAYNMTYLKAKRERLGHIY